MCLIYNASTEQRKHAYVVCKYILHIHVNISLKKKSNLTPQIERKRNYLILCHISIFSNRWHMEAIFSRPFKLSNVSNNQSIYTNSNSVQSTLVPSDWHVVCAVCQIPRGGKEIDSFEQEKKYFEVFDNIYGLPICQNHLRWDGVSDRIV